MSIRAHGACDIVSPTRVSHCASPCPAHPLGRTGLSEIVDLFRRVFATPLEDVAVGDLPRGHSDLHARCQRSILIASDGEGQTRTCHVPCKSRTTTAGSDLWFRGSPSQACDKRSKQELTLKMVCANERVRLVPCKVRRSLPLAFRTEITETRSGCGENALLPELDRNWDARLRSVLGSDDGLPDPRRV